MRHQLYPDLKGRVVLVTGSSKALGAETACPFAFSGAKVVVHGRDEQAIARVVQSIESEGGECFGAGLDLLKDRIHETFGSVDILAAFAGGMGSPVLILDITEEHWRKVIDIALHSKVFVVKAFVPDMITKRRGNIILMSSASGRLVSQASAAYGAAQAATLMFMRHLAQELGPLGIRANAIAPSITRNEKIEKFMPAEVQARSLRACRSAA